ncbi:hypothetical protein [Actinomycetospora straminea]|uniref:Zinc finger protein n=1 Tax=Actinomycetospora straminea TaxID=663607 RepID=A0ABP9FG29_9PSEU|nr:hypothetical protein [Actinomycetospora straminea]MDD7934764.1 hypothetical protein [Actinomycetospora straminea]
MDGLSCTRVLAGLEQGWPPDEHDLVVDHLAACSSCAERAGEDAGPLDEGLERRLLEFFRCWRGGAS